MFRVDSLTISLHYPGEEDGRYLWNVGLLMPFYTASHPRRKLSVWSSPSEQQLRKYL